MPRIQMVLRLLRGTDACMSLTNCILLDVVQSRQMCQLLRGTDACMSPTNWILLHLVQPRLMCQLLKIFLDTKPMILQRVIQPAAGEKNRHLRPLKQHFYIGKSSKIPSKSKKIAPAARYCANSYNWRSKSLNFLSFGYTPPPPRGVWKPAIS